MLIEYWADYICPWCYLATDRVVYLVEEHGVEMHWRPFELHPEIPPEGGEAPALRRAKDAKTWLRDELAAAGLSTRRRSRWSNSRKALALSTWAQDRPEWPALHAALYRAYWADGRDIGSTTVLTGIAAETGIPVSEAESAVADGSGLGEVAASRERALELGIGNTPGWLLDNGVAFTGVHERQVFDKVIGRATARPR